MAWKDWNPELPVVVCGVENGVFTESGLGSQRFANFAEALTVFPDLDPTAHGGRFTQVFPGSPNAEGVTEARFETWAAQRFYST